MRILNWVMKRSVGSPRGHSELLGGHIEVNRFTKRSSRITLGYIEVGVLIGVMEVV